MEEGCTQGRCIGRTLQIVKVWSDPAVAQSIGRIGGIALDSQGVLYLSDAGKHQILRLESTGALTVFAGSGQSGFSDGRGQQAQFWGPQGLAFDKAGNLYVADAQNHAIRRIDLAGNVATVLGGRGSGFVDGKAQDAVLNRPQELLFDAKGVLIWTEQGNNAIRKLEQGDVSTFASQSGRDGRGGMVPKISLSLHKDFAQDSAQNLYYFNTPGQALYRLSPTAQETRIATQVTFSYPQGLAFDAQGNLYIGEFGVHRIRRMKPTGEIAVFAGVGAENPSLLRSTWERIDFLLFDPIRGALWVVANQTKELYRIE